MTSVKLSVVLMVVLLAGCTRNGSERAPDSGSAPIAPEPVARSSVEVPPPSASAAPALPPPPAASARPPAPAPGACRSRTSRGESDIIGSERLANGKLAPVVAVVPGEQLCIETGNKGWSLVDFKLAQTTEHPDRTLAISLTRAGDGGTGLTLRIENPSQMMLHYSLAVLHAGKKKPEPAVACPAEPGKAKETQFPADVTRVVVSNLHLKGPGTAGSMLCQ